MQIVIEVDDDLYTRLFDNGVDNYDDAANMAKAIRKGKVLPKGHGRLVDAKKLLNTFWTYCKQGDFGYHQAEDLIKSAHTIVEADKKYEVKVITRGNCMMCGKELTEGLFLCKECEVQE